MLEKFEKTMAAFSFRQHQDALTYLTRLESEGWTVGDAQEWVKEQKEKKRAVEENFIPRYFCSDCRTPMRLLLVNTNKANQTGDDSKSVWVCMNPNCLYTEYSTKTIKEWNEELKKGGT